MNVAEKAKNIILGASSASEPNSHPSSKVIDGICVDTRIISELEKWQYYKLTRTDQISKFIVMLKQLNITGTNMELVDDKIHFGGKIILLVPRWRDYAPSIKILEESSVDRYYVTEENNQLMLKRDTITKTTEWTELTFQFPNSGNSNISLISFFANTTDGNWALRIYSTIKIYTPEIMEALEETLYNINSFEKLRPADIIHRHPDLLKSCSIELSRFNTAQWKVSITGEKCTVFIEYDRESNSSWSLFSNDILDPKETLRYSYEKMIPNAEHRKLEEEMQFVCGSFKFETQAADPVKRLMECMESLKKQVEKAKTMVI